MSEADDKSVLIVGGGWAGLAAGVELARAGRAVTLLESARQAGGRARRVALKTGESGHLTIDNGQHLLLGACHTLLELLDIVGVPRERLLRRPLQLHLRHLRGRDLKLTTPPLPAPLHLLAALLGASGLSLRERLAALRPGRLLARQAWQPEPDISVAALLQRLRQPARLIGALWEPLCLAIMNTPPREASARLFLRVLRDVFLQRRADADLLQARTDLGSLFPDPAIQYIEQRDGHLHLGMRVQALAIEQGRIQGVRVEDSFIPARQVVLATSIPATLDLIRGHAALAPLHARLSRFRFEPITTLYLQYPPGVRLPQPMLGVIGGQAQWLFDRRHCDQPGLIAVIISSRGPHMQAGPDQLSEAIAAELARLFPDWPAPLSRHVIREKRATFSSQVGIDALRPGNATPVEGLWLAGDYTATGYPATLEGAVRSGVQCAASIAQQSPPHAEIHS